MKSLHALAFAAACCSAAWGASSQDQTLRLNQIQVVGTHNSYNLGFAPSEAAYLKKQDIKAYESLEYSHKSLQSQLDGGVRQLEIDVYADPEGGKFAHPKIVELSKQAGLPADSNFDPEGVMNTPGFKVIHIQDLNQRSSCLLFKECLSQIRRWSNAHPRHVPLFLLIENKSGVTPTVPGGVIAQPFAGKDFDALDAEIRSVFKASEIVLPDQVRGQYKTLEQAVLAGHWPTLGASRGKVIFLMDQKASEAIYTTGHPNLEGRVLFTNSDPGKPDAAFIEMNNGTPTAINDVVKRGYIVRARADEGTVAARDNDTTRRDELMKSGAQMISTDYPLSEPSGWSGYSVGFPDGMPVRCNPVTAPASCKQELLEPGASSAGKPSPQHNR